MEVLQPLQLPVNKLLSRRPGIRPHAVPQPPSQGRHEGTEATAWRPDREGLARGGEALIVIIGRSPARPAVPRTAARRSAPGGVSPPLGAVLLLGANLGGVMTASGRAERFTNRARTLARIHLSIFN